MNWTELDLGANEVLFSDSGDSLVIINVDEFVRNDQRQHDPMRYEEYSNHSDGSEYRDSSRTGSPLFASRWAGKCWRCDDRWAKGDYVGFPAEYNKPVCSSCHASLNTFVPYGGY